LLNPASIKNIARKEYVMFTRIKALFQDEAGITALETAIILIAFVVVAAVFAFTILSAGTVSTEKGKEAIFSGLEEVSSSLELRGSVLAISNTVGIAGTGEIGHVVFTVGNVAGGSAIDLTDTTGENKVVIDYRDGTQYVSPLDWTVDWPVRRDTDDLLEDGELAKIDVDLSAVGLGPDTAFALEIKPPRGGVLMLEKSTPSYIDSVIDFN
jgi:archaeal flagellin FlaB